MKLARLYIPKYPNYQVELLEDRLLDAFGGYTLVSAFGVGTWRNPESKEVVREPVYVYDVVIQEKVGVLRAILDEYKVEAAQLSVLYVLDNIPIFI
jgi:hypothetical protein